MSAQWTFRLTSLSFQSSTNVTSSSTFKPAQAFFPCNNPDNLVEEATAKTVEKIFHLGVLPLIELFGVVTNIINCLVFVRQGLKDRINLCLFSLALADISFLLLIFAAKFFTFLGLFDKELEDYWSKKYLGTILGPMSSAMNMSNLMTMIISVERCICVVSPFTAKKFLKTRYMAVLIVTVAVYVMGVYSLLDLKYLTVRVTDLSTNTSRWVSRHSAFFLQNQVVISVVYNYLLSLTVPCLSLAVVTITTSITVVKLRTSWAWRKQCAIGKESAGDRREAAVTKMLTVVCVIYITTTTPSVTQVFFRTLVPGYLPSGKYCNMFVILQTMAHVCEVTNSSLNFIVYFTMGTRFRATVRQLFAPRPG